MRLKRNTERADGKVYWSTKIINGVKKEVWITKEQFKKWNAGRLKYVREKTLAYHEEQKKLPKEERNYFGKLDPVSGLYFCKISSSGKPVFVTFEKLQEYKARSNIRKKRYYQRCKQFERPAVYLGDKHPSIDGLFVKRICNNKVFYGTYEEAQKCIQSLKNSYKKYKQKHKDAIKMRQKQSKQKVLAFLKENPQLRRKRGDVDLVLNRVFWQYDDRGNEFWLSQEKFKKYSEAAKLKRKLLHMKKEM